MKVGLSFEVMQTSNATTACFCIDSLVAFTKIQTIIINKTVVLGQNQSFDEISTDGILIVYNFDKDD